MRPSSAPDPYQRHWLAQAAASRWLLIAVGAGCTILGLLALLRPERLFVSVVRLTAWLLIGSAAFKVLPLFAGGGRIRARGLALLAGQVGLDVALAMLLLNHKAFSAGVLCALLGLLFAGEGVVLFMLGLKAPTVHTRAVLWISAAILVGMGLTIVFPWKGDRLALAGLLIGVKLIVFGVALVTIGLETWKLGAASIYEEPIVLPEPAELYAVYFGAAFHLGVAIGDGTIVHYLDDNQVHHVTWDTFLEGRTPQHWSYPDLPQVPAEEVIRVALSEVGKTYPYSLLTHNCEHFAIFCKSGGTTRSSKYAQVQASVANVETHPLLGLVAEANTRIVEFLAFHLGGPSGRKLSLEIRRIGSLVTAWLLSRATPAK
jgi:uncharacterized membrane protein HdeD (DUF308 family)